MALDAKTMRLLRAELGVSVSSGVDDDDTLEAVFNEEGRRDVLLTSWFIWKRRLADLQHRSFDVTTGGSLLSRRQRVAFIQGKIAELEFSLGSDKLARSRGENTSVPTHPDARVGSEFSA